MTIQNQKVLDYIRSFIAEKGFPPTTREIQKHFGYASQTAAVRHVEAIENAGLISRQPRMARSIRILTCLLLPFLLISCTQKQPESPPAHEPSAMLYTGNSLPDVEIHIIEAGGHKFAVAVSEHGMAMVELK